MLEALRLVATPDGLRLAAEAADESLEVIPFTRKSPLLLLEEPVPLEKVPLLPTAKMPWVTNIEPPLMVTLPAALLAPTTASRTPAAVAAVAADPLAAVKREGMLTYNAVCALCHGEDGAGKAGVAPPLAGSDWVNADGPNRLMRITCLIVAGLRRATCFPICAVQLLSRGLSFGEIRNSGFQYLNWLRSWTRDLS